jgi:glycerophosphoryl diester phosphodiesterase
MVKAGGMRRNERTLIAAHRAGAGLWPENSMTAFRNALMTDVDFIEFDVHRTRDGVLVVHHDAVLGRTADGDGALGGMAWPDLKRIALRGLPNERIPLLTTVLGVFDESPIRPRVELKADAGDQIYPGMTAAVCAILRATGLAERAVITSFDPAYLEEARREGVTDMIWLLDREASAALMTDIDGFAREASARGIGQLAVRGADASADLVKAFADRGLVLGAYAGKDMDFERLLGIGLSVFTTDRPDLAVMARNGLLR